MRWLVTLLAIALAVSPAFARHKRKPPIAKKQPTRPPRDSMPLPKPQLSDQDAEIALQFFNFVIDVVVASKGDCSTVAGSINMLFDQNRELIRKMREAQLAGMEVPKSVTDKMTRRVNDVMPIMTKCMNDPEVTAALARLDDPNAKKPPAID